MYWEVYKICRSKIYDTITKMGRNKWKYTAVNSYM